MAKIGRPSKMTPEVQERVLELIATGHSVQQIEKMDGIPEEKSIYGLLIRDPIFAEKYTRAREAQHPQLWDYADQVDTMKFLLDLYQ